MQNNIAFELPIKTVSEANSSEHWTKKSKRHKQQQMFIRLAFQKYVKNIQLPCLVKMIRLGPRTLDSDENLPMSFKWVKDEISECLLPEYRKTYINKHGKVIAIKGRADDDKRIIWKYEQYKQSKSGIRIEISFENNESGEKCSLT